jgi:ATP-dependent DNA helicase 2 subunit 2
MLTTVPSRQGSPVSESNALTVCSYILQRKTDPFLSLTGPTNIPIQHDVAALVASKNDKGMAVFGFTPLASVPAWNGMEEARVLVPWPSKAGSAAAGMAASAGTSDREAGKAAAAMSALARAMKKKGVAALTRAVFTQNSDKVSFGALTPWCVPEGDFLVFTPLPFAEDAYVAEFKPLVTENRERSDGRHSKKIT